MRKRNGALALCLCLLLTGCGQNTPPENSPSPSPAPSAVSPVDVTPEPSPAPLWASLTVEDLPTEPADLETFFLLSSPQICLLAQVEELDLTFYGLNPGYGGGVLLREGDTLTHFDQDFGAIPEIRQSSYSGGQETELAVLWPLFSQSSAYDLVFYRSSPDGWSACSVSRDSCLEQVDRELDLDWNERTHTLTLSFKGHSAVRQFPTDTAPGRLTLGHMCLFYEADGRFYMTMDAWSDVLQESLAVFRAEVLYDGETFTLKDLQMDSMAGV